MIKNEVVSKMGGVRGVAEESNVCEKTSGEDGERPIEGKLRGWGSGPLGEAAGAITTLT